MKKRILAMLLVINMLASVLLCVNASPLSEEGQQLFTASAESIETSSYSVGDTIVFGSYEQDNDSSNGTEPIEWIVIDNSGGKLMLISKYGLFTRRYNIDYDEKKKDQWRTTWEKCKLRAYLNDDFFNAAFSASEQKHICVNNLTHMDNPEFGTDGGNDTTDKVFLLSQDEFETYITSDSLKKLKPTAYAKTAALKPNMNASGYCLWWLRTPGRHPGNAEYVMYNGAAYQFGSDVGHQLAVRPVIRIQKDAIKDTESITLSAEILNVKSTDSVSLTAEIAPPESGFPAVWTSSNTKVATVTSNSGKITIVGPGKTTITVKSGGCTDSCEINVDPGFTLKAMGGSVRVSDPYGLRFGIQLMKDAAYTKCSGSIVGYGTLIIPKSNLGDGELNLSTPKVMKIPASNIYSQDKTQLTYTGVLVGIPNTAFGDEIVGRGYLTYKDGSGNEYTIYTEAITRTYRQVAESAFTRYEAMENRNKNDQAVYEKLKSIIETMG